MKLTENQLRNVIRKTILEARTKTIDLAALLSKNRITLPGQISRAMVDLAILGSEGWETVSHLPFSGKYQKGVDLSGPDIYQAISRAVNAGDLQSTIDAKKVCTFEVKGYQCRFTFGLRQPSPTQKCREEAEALRTVYNVPESEIRNELEDMGWTKSDIRKALK